MADNNQLEKTPKNPKKDSWADSTPVTAIKLIGALGLSAYAVSQDSKKVMYISSAILGTAIGALYLNDIFNFDYQYSEDDKNAILKGKIEGALIGGVLSVALSSMRDDNLSVNKKMIISGGIGSLIGYISSDAEFFGEYTSLSSGQVNCIGTIIGAAAGVGLYVLANKITKK